MQKKEKPLILSAEALSVNDELRVTRLTVILDSTRLLRDSGIEC